jgi:hypothetical protein
VPSDDTGKSRVLGAIREAYEADGYRVTGMSWTNSVVQDMRQDGFAHASTIAAAMKRLEAGTLVWSRKDVLIVDEAAMLATQHLAGVVGRAREAGAKVMTFLDGVEQRRWADKPGLNRRDADGRAGRPSCAIAVSLSGVIRWHRCVLHQSVRIRVLAWVQYLRCQTHMVDQFWGKPALA